MRTLADILTWEKFKAKRANGMICRCEKEHDGRIFVYLPNKKDTAKDIP